MIRKIIVANWKMYKTPEETIHFVDQFHSLIPKDLHQQIFISAQSILLPYLKSQIEKYHSEIQIGAQNCYFKKEGAFTGEISPYTLQKFGCHFALVGHSERRKLFQENNSLLRDKILSLLEYNILPLYCVGETLEERKTNKTFSILKTQIEEALKGLPLPSGSKTPSIILAYEPVWAIGTGEVASPEQAQEAHAFIRRTLKEIYPKMEVPILYGGSVKPENAPLLIREPDIDGFLVGGASLDPQSFSKICHVLKL